MTYWFLHSLHIPSSPPRTPGGSPMGVWGGFEKTLGHWPEGSELLNMAYGTLHTWLLYFTDLWPHHPTCHMRRPHVIMPTVHCKHYTPRCLLPTLGLTCQWHSAHSYCIKPLPSSIFRTLHFAKLKFCT